MGTRMTVRQAQYAEQRLLDAYDSVLGQRPCSSDHDRYSKQVALVKSGKFKVTQAMVNRAIKYTEQELQTKRSWHHSFAHHLESVVGEEMRKRVRVNISPQIKAWDKRKIRLDKKFQIAKDELLLGDAGLALTIIEGFRNIKI